MPPSPSAFTRSFICLEDHRVHNPSMRHSLKILLMVIFSNLGVGFAMASAGAVASDWVDFREVRIRLIMEKPVAGRHPRAIEAGLEMVLQPGFKTYWRHAGDSGVPPNFDFSRSVGLKDAAVAFPFPETFDDGAGGKAIGYKDRVIFPISADLTDDNPSLHLKLDFAVCGTMCIPLSGEVTLTPARASPLGVTETPPFAALRVKLPQPLAADGAIEVTRIAGSHPARWRIRFRHAGDTGAFAAFAEAKGFAEIIEADLRPEGMAHLLVGVDRIAGAGTYGPLRLTYGNKDRSFERMVDLDAAPLGP
jgi:DsbC/DsbD-like thiol-disulfide interchange protein